MNFDIPEFMRGTTAWSHFGYFYPGLPTIDLLTTRNLEAENPWLVLACVLEHAKRGDFRYISYLEPTYYTTEQNGPDRASIFLTADAGRSVDLERLKQLLRSGPSQLRVYAASAACQIGTVDFIEPMLDAWLSVESPQHHQSIGYSIASVLEPDGGEIGVKGGDYRIHADVIDRLPRTALSKKFKQELSEEGPTEFETMVRERVQKLSEDKDDQICYWKGEPFELKKLHEEMYDVTRSQEKIPLHGLFLAMRRKFESVTGIDCSPCYENGVLRPLSAQAFLESAADAIAFSDFEPGKRYFFGRPIPS